MGKRKRQVSAIQNQQQLAPESARQKPSRPEDRTSSAKKSQTGNERGSDSKRDRNGNALQSYGSAVPKPPLVPQSQR